MGVREREREREREASKVIIENPSNEFLMGP
jgi:hypothetical protein